MKAEIITIGDEILIGQVVDTNSAWMSEQLNLCGVEVFQITSVHDNHDHILTALKEASQRAQLVLITGGLGPTKDDITKKVLCEYFNTELVFHPEILEHVKTLLTQRNVAINQLNRDQALLPASCTILHNPVGTAPGMWFEKDGVIYVSMPGVPFEMEAIMSGEVLPRLKKMNLAESIVHKTILTQGIPESMLAETIAKWEENLPEYIKLAYLPSPTGVRLRLSAYGTDEAALRAETEKQVTELQKIIPEYIYGYDNQSMSEVIGRLLIEMQQTMAVAESCTGGYISHLVTEVPGCSAYYNGSVTAYSNEVKVNVLGVSQSSLDQFGAVSRQVAEEMASGVQKLMKADFAVATTGIAGPDGGTQEKPVGTVWIAVAGHNRVVSQKFTFRHNRERNIIRSAQAALNMLRQLILTEKSIAV
jgi:nicotinamide-nucleotide amidase